jgi:hypothetical protein
VTVHFLVEGPSERAFFDGWAPRALGGQKIRVHPHEGKGKLPKDLAAAPPSDQRQLLTQLPAKLRGYAEASNVADLHVVVVLDADDDDPDELARAIESAARTVAPKLRVTVRLAVEETEAFYLGDLKGLRKAYPAADMKRAQDYVPDSICGTWELFSHVIDDGGERKVEWAETMGPLLTTKAEESRSPSFKRLVTALTAAAPGTAPKKPRKKYRHPTKNKRDVGGRR